jgi:5-methylcytosine-specific restriction enzyme A
MSAKNSPHSPSFWSLDPAHTDPKRLKKEREKARELKSTGWWKTELSKGLCHYCQGKFKPGQLTMDHVTPLARGGTSVKANIVPACKPCNQSKKLETPVDDLFRQLEEERRLKAPLEHEDRDDEETEG